jgi:hypothetical protein
MYYPTDTYPTVFSIQIHIHSPDFDVESLLGCVGLAVCWDVLA